MKSTLTEQQKKTIRDNYDRINPEKLKEAAKSSQDAREMLKYYNQVKAGKSRYKKALKINGKIVGRTFQKQIERDAKNAGFTLAEYWNRNKRIIADFYVNGYITKKKKAAEIIKLAADLAEKKYQTRINGVNVTPAKFAAKLTEAESYLTHKTGAGFILFKVYISDARKIVNVPLNITKIKTAANKISRAIKRRGKDD